MTETEITTENKTLRIKIDQRWSSADFSNLFESLTFLYQIFIEIDSLDFMNVQLYNTVAKSSISENLSNINGLLYRRLRYSDIFENEQRVEAAKFGFVVPREREYFPDLEITKIKYSSPGFSDFVGLGKIIEQIFEFIKYYLPNKMGELELEEREQDILYKKIKNLEELGYSKKEIRKLFEIRNTIAPSISELYQLKKITGVELKKEGDI
ncbi:MAG: hypothetical protein ABJ092_14705 [Gillisia sp.]